MKNIFIIIIHTTLDLIFFRGKKKSKKNTENKNDDFAISFLFSIFGRGFEFESIFGPSFMLRFHETDKPLFDFVLRIDKHNDTYERTVIYKFCDEIPKSFQNISVFCFPFNKQTFTKAAQFCFSLTDTNKTTTYAFVYLNNRVAFCIVTRFFHPRFYLYAVKAISEMEQKDYSANIQLFLEMKLIHGKYDWTFDRFPPCFNSSAQAFIKNFSPECELSRLFQFIFKKLHVSNILSALVAMLLDCKIAVISADLEMLGNMVFALIALIFPLDWPGTFIPILPPSILTTLDAPFAYIVGLHSSVAEKLLDIVGYFVINVDVHYAAIVGMENFPPNILQLISTWTEKIRSLLNQFSPIFPFVQVQNKIREFIIDLFQCTFNNKNIKPDDLIQYYNQWRCVPTPDFPAILSQSQLFNCLISKIDYEPDERVFQAFWPNEKFTIKMHSKDNDNNDASEKHTYRERSNTGLPLNRKRSIDARQANEIALRSKNDINMDQLLNEINNEDGSLMISETNNEDRSSTIPNNTNEGDQNLAKSLKETKTHISKPINKTHKRNSTMKKHIPSTPPSNKLSATQNLNLKRIHNRSSSTEKQSQGKLNKPIPPPLQLDGSDSPKVSPSSARSPPPKGFHFISSDNDTLTDDKSELQYPIIRKRPGFPKPTRQFKKHLKVKSFNQKIQDDASKNKENKLNKLKLDDKYKDEELQLPSRAFAHMNAKAHKSIQLGSNTTNSTNLENHNSSLPKNHSHKRSQTPNLRRSRPNFYSRSRHLEKDKEKNPNHIPHKIEIILSSSSEED